MAALETHDGSVPGPYTVADLASFPDDGRRHELIDGVLVVSPSPFPLHQIVLSNLHRLVAAGETAGLFSLFAPFDFEIDDITLLQPDLLVVRIDDLSPKSYDGTPELVVEVLSKSTRKFDRFVKLASYAEAGVPSYWIIDPEAPSIVVHRLGDAGYSVVATAEGDQDLTVEVPFPVTINPAALARLPGRAE